MKGQPVGIFYSSVKSVAKPLFKGMLLLSGVFLIFTIVALSFGEKELDLSVTLAILGLPILGPMVLFIILVLILRITMRFCPVKVFHEGIYSYDILGIYKFVKWESITRIEVSSGFSLSSIMVYAEELKRPLSIPLYLNDMEQFLLLVKKKDRTGVFGQNINLA